LLDPAFWWLALMVAVWAVFALVVFVLEPLVIHRLFHVYALRDKEPPCCGFGARLMSKATR
jgi:hypothetical protein